MTTNQDKQTFDVGATHLIVKTTSGIEYRLAPVKMPRLPSENPEDRLHLLRAHVAGSELDEGSLAQIQLFMRVNRTEALTDGTDTYTVAGDRLAFCNPKEIL